MKKIGSIKYLALIIMFVSHLAYSNVSLTDKPIELVKLESIANNGDIETQYNLGYIYMHGYNLNGNWISKDYTKGYYWTKKAANNQHYEAMHNLGTLYRDGKGVTKDIKKSRYWFKQASQNGIIRSSWSLIVLNIDEHKPIKEVANYSKVVIYAKNIAMQNYNNKHYDLALGDLLYLSKLGDVDSKFLVAYIFISENNSNEEIKRAIEIFEELCEQKKDIDSLLILGQLFEEGQLVKKDTIRSNKYYKQAYAQLSNKKNLKATDLYNLAVLLEFGTGIDKDISKAITMYEKAAKKGDQQAMQAIKRLSGNSNTNVKSNKKLNMDSGVHAPPPVN